MAKSKLHIPTERRKVTLKAQVMKDRVAIVEAKERIQKNRAELELLKPPKKTEDS